jgi:endonuclease YncB( thermonuclease family)
MRATVRWARRRTATAEAVAAVGLFVAGAGACGDPTGTSVTVSSLAPIGATESAHVVRVVDGDTIVIDRGRGSERLRYIGIDAPESVMEDTPVEFMGVEASAANERLVDGRDVTLEPDVSDVDQYGRLLRYVWLRDGDTWTFVNLELVRRGFANAVTYPPDVRWTEVLREAERQARDEGDGLWGPPTPAP